MPKGHRRYNALDRESMFRALSEIMNWEDTRILWPNKVIANFSDFEQKLGHSRIYNSLILQHSGYCPKIEDQPTVT